MGEPSESRTDGFRIGSLFSGAGGLDMAVESVFGGRVVWHAEIDPAASKVLAHHWPDVPNLGDVSAIDWLTVPEVDVLCGGFPCQDVSAAGKRAGIKDGTRSGLWSVFADAIDVLRPQFVVIENVRGLLSAQAHRNLESEHATMGNGEPRPVLRAAGAVLGDLADLGYDAQWATVAAADIGAPHRRERVFIVARAVPYTGHDAGCSEQRLEHQTQTSGVRESSSGTTAVAGSTSIGLDAGGTSTPQTGTNPSDRSGDHRGERTDALDLLPTPSTHDRTGSRSPESLARMDKPFTNLNDTVVNELVQRGSQPVQVIDGQDYGAVPVFTCNGCGQHTVAVAGNGNCVAVDVCGSKQCHSPVIAAELAGIKHELLPTPNASDASGGGQHPDKREGHSRQLIDYVLAPSQWGKYEPAIRRWEKLTRPAPAPTEPNKNGNPRLSAAFSEWLMGWPDGWVTDPDIGISRNDQLKIVGNGVCPQQAAAALRFLLTVSEVGA